MKIFIPTILGLFLLYSCGEEVNKPDLIEEGVMMSSSIQDTCLCDELQEEINGQLTKNSVVFTGICVHNYPNSEDKYMVKSILNGKLHGTVTYFDPTGIVLFEEVYEDGNKKRTGDGSPQVCNCTELEKRKIGNSKIYQAFLDDIPFTGKCLEKYPNMEQTYMEISYKKGLQNGFTTFFDKQGKTMYMEKYEEGKLVKVINEN